MKKLQFKIHLMVAVIGLLLVGTTCSQKTKEKNIYTQNNQH
jgi:hypothetical protein